MSLLTDLAVAGVAGGDAIVMFWQADGTSNGYVDTEEAWNTLHGNPPGTGNNCAAFDSGAIAIDAIRERIYLNVRYGSGHAGETCVLMTDADGTPIEFILPVEDAGGYALCVPQGGRLWIPVVTVDSNPIREYDERLRSITRDAADAGADLNPAYGMARHGRYLYVNTLAAGAGTAGIYRLDLRDGGAPVQIVPGTSGGSPDRMRGFAQHPATGDLFVTQNGAADRVQRYSIAGVLLQTYTLTDGALEGSAIDSDGLHFWVGNSTGSQLHKVRISDGAVITSFDATSTETEFNGGLFAGDALACPLVPHLVDGPCSKHTHAGVVS